MDYIGGMLNPIGKMLKTHNKNEFGYGFTGKIMVYNVILMENIGISVMASIVLLFSRDGLDKSLHILCALFHSLRCYWLPNSV